MAHAPECSGRVYGCRHCEASAMTIEESFRHSCPGKATARLARFLDKHPRHLGWTASQRAEHDRLLAGCRS